jgi:hypothetical protein
MGSTAKIAVAAAVEVLHGARDEEALDSVDDAIGLGDGGVADAHRGAVAALRGSRGGELDLLARRARARQRRLPAGAAQPAARGVRERMGHGHGGRAQGLLRGPRTGCRCRGGSRRQLTRSWRPPTAACRGAAGSGTAAGAVSQGARLR